MAEYINKEKLIEEIKTWYPYNWHDSEVELAEQRAYDDIIDLIKDFNDDESDRINELAKADDEGRIKIYDKGYKCPECGSYTYFATKKGDFECIKCGCHINCWGVDAYISVLMDVEEERIKESEIDEESKKEKIDTMKKTFKEYSEYLKKRDEALEALIRGIDGKVEKASEGLK